jgi:hypothetical protein
MGLVEQCNYINNPTDGNEGEVYVTFVIQGSGCVIGKVPPPMGIMREALLLTVW